MADTIRFRRFEARDTDALQTLDALALRDAGTEPADVPGSDDLQTVGESYLDAGGEFLVGVLSGAAVNPPDKRQRRLPETTDGSLVAMGGFLPTEAGYEDERSVTGAAELHRMRVAPTHQGRGYGRALLGELERRAREAGFDLLLVTTARRQHRAVRFYDAAGYDEVDRSEYGEYELVHFEKSIGDRS